MTKLLIFVFGLIYRYSEVLQVPQYLLTQGAPWESYSYSCLVAKLCLTLLWPMDCNLPGSIVHGISQARILEWVTVSFSSGSSWPKDWTLVSCTGRRIPCHWAIREAQLLWKYLLWRQITYFTLRAGSELLDSCCILSYGMCFVLLGLIWFVFKADVAGPFR